MGKGSDVFVRGERGRVVVAVSGVVSVAAGGAVGSASASVVVGASVVVF